MSAIGSFLKGAAAGVAGLGLLSWFIATQWGEISAEDSEDEPKEED